MEYHFIFTQESKSLKNKGLGQYVDKWKINNKKYSPSNKIVKQKDGESCDSFFLSLLSLSCPLPICHLYKDFPSDG